MEHKVRLKAVEYKGRKAVLLTRESEGEGLAILRSSPFADGTIEADVAVRLTTPPGARNPGFIGLAFRSRPDALHYDLFYLRPGNSQAWDQAMRNHSTQYIASPGDYTFVMNLRREGDSVSGTASGLLGSDLPVSGSWRSGYLELAFRGTWPQRDSGEALAKLSGWIDGTSARGRLSVSGRADGVWTASKKE